MANRMESLRDTPLSGQDSQRGLHVHASIRFPPWSKTYPLRDHRTRSGDFQWYSRARLPSRNGDVDSCSGIHFELDSGFVKHPLRLRAVPARIKKLIEPSRSRPHQEEVPGGHPPCTPPNGTGDRVPEDLDARAFLALFIVDGAQSDHGLC